MHEPPRTTTPRCSRCGYELSGLQVDGRCPECNADIWQPASNAMPTSGMAIASLVLGVLTILGCATFGPLAILTGLPGVILGHLAMGQVRKQTHGGATTGLAVAGLVMSYIGLVLSIVAIVFFGLMFAGMAAAGGGGGFTPAGP